MGNLFNSFKMKTGFISALIIIAFYFLVIGCSQKPPENSRVVQAGKGKVHFMTYCSACHGEDGKGLRIDSLNTQPADLTLILKNRKTEEFPVLEIANMIDGRRMSDAHGSRVMPVWGEVFSEAEHLDELEIKGKLGELIAYLMSIQE